MLNEWNAKQEANFKALINEKMPKKVLHLTHILDTWEAADTIEELYKTDTEFVLPESFELMRVLQDVGCFLRRRLPKIEDGHNFGVDVIKEILETIVANIRQLEALAKNVRTYYWYIGDTQAQLSKYPATAYAHEKCIDVTLQLAIGDSPSAVRAMRDIYVVLCDRITKNMDVILVPRNKQESSMY